MSMSASPEEGTMPLNTEDTDTPLASGGGTEPVLTPVSGTPTEPVATPTQGTGTPTGGTGTGTTPTQGTGDGPVSGTPVLTDPTQPVSGDGPVSGTPTGGTGTPTGGTGTPTGGTGTPTPAAPETIVGLYDFVDNWALVDSVSISLSWSDMLTLVLEYSQDGTVESDASYAAATWTPIPISPAPSGHGGTDGAQTWHILFGFVLDCNLLRLTATGHGGSLNHVKLTDFRYSTTTERDLWSPGTSRIFYPAPLLVDKAVGDGSTGYDAAV